MNNVQLKILLALEFGSVDAGLKAWLMRKASEFKYPNEIMYNLYKGHHQERSK